MMFDIGDAVVDPVRGAGVVSGFKKFDTFGEAQRYYLIRLQRQNETELMIPVTQAESRGLRPAVTRSRLEKVWQVLCDTPEKLPSNHKKRYKVVTDKFKTGDVFLLAEAVRDMSWRGHEEDGFTVKGKRLYQKGLRLLSGEIAVTLKINLDEAEKQIKTMINKALKSREPVAA